MSEWLESLLAAVGGGTVVLIGVLTIFKGLIVKLFETGIATSFEKDAEKFKNKLNQSTRAFELLLEREIRFYENIKPITAEILILESDLVSYLDPEAPFTQEAQQLHLPATGMRYCELIKLLKNEVLLHQIYIPPALFCAFTAVVKQMQDDLPFWSQTIETALSEKTAKIDTAKNQEIADNLIKRIAQADQLVYVRLRELSGEE